MQINRQATGEALLYINTDNRKTAGVMAASALEWEERGQGQSRGWFQNNMRYINLFENSSVLHLKKQHTHITYDIESWPGHFRLNPWSVGESLHCNPLIWNKGEVVGHNEKTRENKSKKKRQRFGTQMGGADINAPTLILLSGLYLWCVH